MHISSDQIQNKPYSIRLSSALSWIFKNDVLKVHEHTQEHEGLCTNTFPANFILNVIKSQWFHAGTVPHTGVLNLFKADYK